MPIPFIMADDNAHYRESFPGLLRHQSEIEMIAQAHDGLQLLQLANELQPPLIITDVEMPGLNGVEVFLHLKAHHPQIKVLMLSMFLQRMRLAQLVQAGAKGFLQKDTSTEELLTAVNKVMKGEMYYSAWLAPIIGDLLKEACLQLELKAAHFTKRELEVIILICRGFKTREIAAILFLTYFTVETYRRNILEKAGVKNGAELVAYAIEHGIYTTNGKQAAAL